MQFFLQYCEVLKAMFGEQSPIKCRWKHCS